MRRTSMGQESLPALALLSVLVLVMAGCSSSGDSASPSTSATESTPPSSRAAPTTTPPPPTTSDPETGTTAPSSDGDPFTPATPEVSGPIEAAGPIVQPQPALAAPDGFVEEEFFIGGEATRFELVGATETDGRWTAAPTESAAYQTRVIVRRPPADRFTGVVVVEWLNVSAGESAPDWAYVSEEIAREGHAYVAVSAQALGVVGGQAILSVDADDTTGTAAPINDGGLVNLDPDRYGTLDHPGDAFAYDLFTQVAVAIRTVPALLDGLDATTLVAIGESQSAGYLTTYVNAVHPLSRAYDAFLVHSRGGGATPIGGRFGEGNDFVDSGVTVRDDLDEPVFIVEAETDLTLLGYANARQPDTDTIRTWEVAGTAHADAHTFRAIFGGPRDASQGSLIGCPGLINSGPHHEAVQAALHHLIDWARDGTAPPEAERLQLTDTDPVAIARDERGTALGGVRNPLVDVPVVITTGDPVRSAPEIAAGFEVCDLFGQTLPLDQPTLVELHGSADDYVAAFTAATTAAVEAGFLLPADAEQLLEEAEQNRALFG